MSYLYHQQYYYNVKVWDTEVDSYCVCGCCTHCFFLYAVYFVFIFTKLRRKKRRDLNHLIYLSVKEPPPRSDVHFVQPEQVEFSF